MRRVRIALKPMGMTANGFRILAKLMLHAQGWSLDHIGLQLAHVPHEAVGSHQRVAPQELYLEPRAKMMQAWADFLDKTQREASQFPPPR